MSRSTLLATLLFVAVLAAAVPPTWSKSRIVRHRPEPTTVGSFHGTWYHVSAAMRFAFQIEEGEDGTRVRLLWRARGGLTFETDWAGEGEYVLRGFPGRVQLTVDGEQTDRDVIRGDYERLLSMDGGDHKKESGPFRIYRSGNGDALVWSFEPYRTETRIAERVQEAEADNVFFELRRASIRVIPWDDIPW